MKTGILVIAAVCAWLVGGWNPAITLSRRIYHQDIRTLGSGNPGFTNFKRVFGNRWAWWVMVLDLGKAAVVVSIFAALYAAQGGDYQLGAALTGLFAMAGHAFPVWYGFKGGKGFLVYMSLIWFVDWRAGLLAVLVLVVLLLTTKYMSLSSMCAVTSSVIWLIASRSASLPVIVLCGVQVLFVILRHRENIVRLCRGTESKFRFTRIPDEKRS